MVKDAQSMATGECGVLLLKAIMYTRCYGMRVCFKVLYYSTEGIKSQTSKRVSMHDSETLL